MKVFPVPRELPPELFANQLIVAPLAEADNVPEPGPHRTAPEVVGLEPLTVRVYEAVADPQAAEDTVTEYVPDVVALMLEVVAPVDHKYV